MKKLECIDYFFIGLGLSYFSLISIFPLHFVPDFLNLGDHIEPQMVHATIISTITTILGLLAVLFVIQFETLQKYIGNTASEIFKDNPKFIRVIIWSLISVISAFVSLVSLKKEISGNQISQLYFCTLIFFITLYFIYKFSKSFLEIGNINKKAFVITDSIVENDFSGFHNLNREHNLNHKKLFDDSKFGQIKKIGVSQAKNNEEVGWT